MGGSINLHVVNKKLNAIVRRHQMEVINQEIGKRRGTTKGRNGGRKKRGN